jgi:hypothetical protein
MRKTTAFLFTMAMAINARGQLATQRSGTPQLLIAAAGAVQGGNGQFFRSDIIIINYRTDADQRVRFSWIPQGSSGLSVSPVEIVIPKATGTVSEDFVTSVLHQSGLGSILVTAVTSSSVFDPAGRLHATARIWSNQPGLSSGSVSQSFPIIATSDISSTRLSIIGQRLDDRFRINVGVVNLDTVNSQTFRVIANTGSETLLTLPPLSMTQVPLNVPSTPTLQIAVTNVSTGSKTVNWVAYGSSVDNVTGDSWSSLGFIAPPDQPSP